MLTLTLVAAALLSLAALLYIVWPLLQPGPAPVIVEDDRLSELIGRKDDMLKAIKDLEFDYQVGKLSEEDYARFDQRLRRQAIGLLQQIDQVIPEVNRLDDSLEAEIQQRRKVGVDAATGPPLPSSPPLPAGRPRFCTSCGEPLRAGNRFCANCGAKVEEIS